MAAKAKDKKATRTAQERAPAPPSATADAALITLTMAALSPVLESMLAFSSAAQMQQQIEAVALADTAAPETLARSVDLLLGPPRRVVHEMERPPAQPLATG